MNYSKLLIINVCKININLEKNYRKKKIYNLYIYGKNLFTYYLLYLIIHLNDNKDSFL